MKKTNRHQNKSWKAQRRRIQRARIACMIGAVLAAWVALFTGASIMMRIGVTVCLLCVMGLGVLLCVWEWVPWKPDGWPVAWFAALIFPLLVMMPHTFHEDAADWLRIIVGGLLVALPYGVGVWRGRKQIPNAVSASLCVAMMMLLVGISWTGTANMVYDTGTPEEYPMTVIDRYSHSAVRSGTHWYLVMAYQDAPHRSEKVEVASNVYKSATVGDEATLRVYPGAFGIPYSRVSVTEK